MGTVTVGADPEVWLLDISTGNVVPSCGLIGGTKDHPLPLKKGVMKGFTIQEDNCSVEFNIPPAHNLDQFVSYMDSAMGMLRQYVASKGPYTISTDSQHKFKHKDLQSDQAMAFGCSKDFNAYDNGGEFPLIDPKSLADKGGALRFAGGHIHIGFDADNVPPFVAATFADYFIGLSIIAYDPQQKRRSLYGQPGRYRPTSYGIEYRTPSNFWVSNYTSHIGNSAFSLGKFLSETPVSIIRNAYQKIPWAAVRQAITKSNNDLAMTIINYVYEEKLFPSDLEDSP